LAEKFVLFLLIPPKTVEFKYSWITSFPGVAFSKIYLNTLEIMEMYSMVNLFSSYAWRNDTALYIWTKTVRFKFYARFKATQIGDLK
jgi:hypothetical protein